MKATLLDDFISSVLLHFNFLVENFSFNCIQQEKMGSRYAFIVYQSSEVLIKVSFDSYSFEISFDLIECKGKLRKFSLSDIIRFYHAESQLGFLSPQASTKERIDTTLLIIANFIRTNAVPFLNGDTALFDQLDELIINSGLNKQIETKLGLIRNRLDAAWRNKEYREVVELYAPFEKYLRGADAEKMKYAKKHINK